MTSIYSSSFLTGETFTFVTLLQRGILAKVTYIPSLLTRLRALSSMSSMFSMTSFWRIMTLPQLSCYAIWIHVMTHWGRGLGEQNYWCLRNATFSITLLCGRTQPLIHTWPSFECDLLGYLQGGSIDNGQHCNYWLDPIWPGRYEWASHLAIMFCVGSMG